MIAATAVEGRAPLWRRRPLMLGGLALLMAAAILLSLAIGAVPIAPLRILGIAFGRIEDARDSLLLGQIRLPRTLLAALVGGALGVSGAATQGLFRNPLADPSLIGISMGAALGAVGTITLVHLSSRAMLLPAASFASGLATVCLVWRIGMAGGRRDTGTLLLAGIAVNALAGALTGLLIYGSDDRQLREATFWSMGSLAGASWSHVGILALCVALALLLLLPPARALDAMLLGEREAAHLGIRTTMLKRRMVLGVALAVGASVAMSGLIGFVGLIVPHLVRLMCGPGHRLLMPASALLGATLLVGADCLARILVAPAELPIGLLTSLVGSPFFLWLLLSRRATAQGQGGGP